MSTQNICFCGEIRKISILFSGKNVLRSTMLAYTFPMRSHKIHFHGQIRKVSVHLIENIFLPRNAPNQ